MNAHRVFSRHLTPETWDLRMVNSTKNQNITLIHDEPYLYTSRQHLVIRIFP